MLARSIGAPHHPVTDASGRTGQRAAQPPARRDDRRDGAHRRRTERAVRARRRTPPSRAPVAVWSPSWTACARSAARARGRVSRLRRGVHGRAGTVHMTPPTWPSWRRSAPRVAGTSTPTPTPERIRGPRRGEPQGPGLAALDELERARRRGRLRAGPTAGPPRHRRPGHGLLPPQQRGRRRGVAHGPRRAGPHRRLGRAPRERHPGDLLGRPRRALRLDPPAPALSRERAVPTRSAGRPRPGCTLNLPLPPGATGDVVRAALDEEARADHRGVPPRLGARLVRVRRPSGRPAQRPASSRAATSPSWPVSCSEFAPRPGPAGPLPRRRVRRRRRSHPRWRRRSARCSDVRGRPPAPTDGRPGSGPAARRPVDAATRDRDVRSEAER